MIMGKGFDVALYNNWKPKISLKDGLKNIIKTNYMNIVVADKI